MIKRTLVGCLALVGLMASVSLQAHHSLAGVYDMKAEKELSGTVKSIKFVNPHGTLTVTVKNADGTDGRLDPEHGLRHGPRTEGSRSNRTECSPLRGRH